jgi:competence protein ComEC
MRPGPAPVIDGLAAAAVLGITAAVLAIDVVAGLTWVLVPLAVWALLRARWAVAMLSTALVWGSHSVAQDTRHLQSSCIDGRSAIVAGRVLGLPRVTTVVTRFDLELEEAVPVAGCRGPGPRRLRVSWYEAPALESGERWALEIRVRALRSHGNPGGFDYVGWALQQGVDAAGTVRRGARMREEPVLVRARALGTVHRLRAAIAEWIAGTGAGNAAILSALAVGDAREVTDGQWELFRRTGTIHLLVISGLHIVIAVVCGVLLGRGLSRAVPSVLRRHGEKPVAAAFGAAVAVGYSMLAGFTLPVARACVMSLLGLAWWLAARHVPAYRMLAIVLAVLLVSDPRALLDTSLWLSFGATAILVAYFAPRRGLPWSSGWFRVQFVMAAAMCPVLAASVGQLAWIAPLANIVAVPLVSVLVVPLLLGALTLAPWWADAAAAVVRLADRLCDALLAGLDWIADAPTTTIAVPDPWLLLASFVAASAVLLPLRGWQRACLLPALVLALHRPATPVPVGEVRVWVLDVGQGLAILVDTAHHRLLYDAGAAYPSGFDLGAAVVTPAIEATGDARLDLLVVSHGDMDHRGGVESVRDRVDVRAMLSGAAEFAAPSCRRGQTWQWDGVRFYVLGPDGSQVSDNDGSCVLAIRTRHGSALLAGDIGSRAEGRLVRAGGPLAADLLVAPHHGSRTSSSTQFLAAVAPTVAAFSAGLGNRFAHPHADVVARYVEQGVRWRSTATSGALRWRSEVPGALTPWSHEATVTGAAALRTDE